MKPVTEANKGESLQSTPDQAEEDIKSFVGIERFF